ncbi:biotin--[acetyl-CoA-carboxylase] ligase [Diaminobutyricimonas sp. LJ205]|uniref:biotin--[acetyl-CoA-carboxylase] ligase n=1 Tax=Diaminobutyricimonas sp. LJ205 TaxID=2683590 RepID=UPI0012F4C1D6|nr:biotin--[acetyl-CoA-carboxylase] ligase [Diaminobutyricimonas sp. LJ205]
MHLPRSLEAFPQIRVLEQTGSTNDELKGGSDAGDFSIVVTDHQTAGRGRLGRVWVAPPGQTLAISVLLRPGTGADSFGWLPLIAGLAMSRTVSRLLPDASVGLKWPNDVQIAGLKVSGILAEVTGDADAVILGAGLNLSIPADQLPTPVATSVGLHGDGDPDRALQGYLSELHGLYSAFRKASGDAEASGIRSALIEACTTIGQAVKVQLPGGEILTGEATGVDESGRLLVRTSDGSEVAVAAGDVTHLRYE